MPVAVQSALSPSTAGVLSRCARRMEQFRNNLRARVSWFVPQTSRKLTKPSRTASMAPNQPLPTPRPSFVNFKISNFSTLNLPADTDLLGHVPRRFGLRQLVGSSSIHLRRISRSAYLALFAERFRATPSRSTISITKFWNFTSPTEAICDARLLRGRSYTLNIPIPSPHRSLGSNRNVYDTFPHLFPVTLGLDASTGANAHPRSK